MSKILPFIFLCFLTGCQREIVSVFTEYVSVESLPSYQIGTPDPRLHCPDYGQKLHIKWTLPEKCQYQSLELRLAILFGNGEFVEQWYTLNTRTGIFVYPLLNQDYWDKEGIFTYIVELYGDGQFIDEWRHQMWAERITLNDSCEDSPDVFNTEATEIAERN